jgi:hypothetical protein
VTNWLTVVGLSLDIVGAVLLLKAVVFRSADDYVEAGEDTFYLPVTADRQRAQEVAEGRVGAVLLILGFLGQAVGAAAPNATASGWWWVAFVVALPLGLVALKLISTDEHKKVIQARLFAHPHDYPTHVIDPLEIRFGRDERTGPSRHRGAILGEYFGQERWAYVTEELKAYAARVRNSNANDLPVLEPPPLKWPLWKRLFGPQGVNSPQ